MVRPVSAIQSVVLIAVIAMTAWLLFVEYPRVSSSEEIPIVVRPATQPLSIDPQPYIQPLSIGQKLQQDIDEGGWLFFSVGVPSHASAIRVQLLSTQGDADLYLRRGTTPEGDAASGGQFDASSATQGTQLEEVRLMTSGDEEWFIGVHGYQSSQFQLLTLTE